MYRRRTLQNQDAMKVLSIVLLFVFSAMAGGCRDGETTTAPTQPLPYTMNLPVGALYTYNTWTLDQTYPQLPPAKTVTYWQVLATQQTYQGMSGVTVIADSTLSSTDTLYIAASSAGDIYIFGYLARLQARRVGYGLIPRWDKVAAFSSGMSGTWTVGAADSAGQDVVFGALAGASDYFSTTVDGVTEVFPTYRVDLTGSNLLCSLWFSNSPNAIVRLLDEPEYGELGELQELAGVHTVKH